LNLIVLKYYIIELKYKIKETIEIKYASYSNTCLLKISPYNRRASNQAVSCPLEFQRFCAETPFNQAKCVK
jgi:hypothetical protein